MSHINNHDQLQRSGETAPTGANQDRPVTQSDLKDIILHPLSSLVDDARVEIIEKLRDIEDLIDIVAGQMRRGIDED